MPVIALLTDFGLSDPYVGVLKGVISQHASGCPILDITHGVPPQDVRTGALFLQSAWPYFPEETIFLCVVDPGVGSQRRPAIRRYASRWFVGPDNGLMSLSSSHESAPEPDRWWEIEPDRWLGALPSHTFHGRDLFAPAAARLACGTHPDLLGRAHSTPVRLSLPEPHRTPQGIAGEILYFDQYGNAITNLPPVPRRCQFRHAPDASPMPLRRTYSEVEPGEPLALVGSTGRVEISVREGNARQVLSLRVGQPVFLHLREEGQECIPSLND